MSLENNEVISDPEQISPLINGNIAVNNTIESNFTGLRIGDVQEHSANRNSNQQSNRAMASADASGDDDVYDDLEQVEVVL